MMCGKTLRDGIPNGLLRDRTRVVDIENKGVGRKFYRVGTEKRPKNNTIKPLPGGATEQKTAK